jgi:hypothetical protein
MKKTFNIIVLILLFSQGLYAQFTRQDSTYIAKRIQRGDSLFDRKLYLESSDQYILGISEATHIFSTKRLSPLQKNTLDMFYEELNTKIARNSDLIKTLNADSLQYERCIKIGQGHLVQNHFEVASLEFKNALRYKPQDSLANALLESVLCITSDTLVVARTKPNYFIMDPYYKSVNFYSPPSDLVYQAIDTALYTGVIEQIDFDIPTNSMSHRYNSYYQGQLVKSQKFICPTNIPLINITYAIIDSLSAIKPNTGCNLNSISIYQRSDSLKQEIHITSSANGSEVTHKTDNTKKSIGIEKYIVKANLLDSTLIGKTVSELLGVMRSHKYELITEYTLSFSDTLELETTIYASDSLVQTINYKSKSGNIDRSEVLTANLNGDTMHYAIYELLYFKQIFFDQEGTMTRIYEHETDDSYTTHIKEYNSKRQLIWWTSTKGPNSIVRFLFEIESQTFWLTVHSTDYGPYDFECVNMLYLFSSSIVTEETFIQKMNFYQNYDFNIYFIKLSEYDSDYIPVLYSTRSFFNPLDPGAVAKLHKKILKYKAKEN